MAHLFIPLANWGVGTILIVIFAVVCLALSALVISFIFGAKKTEGEDESSQNDNL